MLHSNFLKLINPTLGGGQPEKTVWILAALEGNCLPGENCIIPAHPMLSEHPSQRATDFARWSLEETREPYEIEYVWTQPRLCTASISKPPLLSLKQCS